MRSVIALVGAFDRFNFGDLLFPAVVEATLGELGVDAEIRCYSIRAADLRGRGGVATRPIAELKTGHPRPSLVIMAGGELLSARWLDAYAGLAGPRRTLAAKMLTKLIGASPVDRLCKRLLGGDRPQPWVLDAIDLGLDAPVTYNGVGGVGVDNLPENLRASARTRLSRAGHLAVRDPETQRALEEWNLPFHVHLTPDPAVLAPFGFPADRLFSAASPETRDVISKMRDGYVVFQTGRYPAWGTTRALADQLQMIHDQTGMAILLVPLGQAPGHEDQAPLQRIQNHLRDLPVSLLPAPDVPDILAAIAGARLVIGSSLHANLTALVYGVPHIGFGDRVRKLDLMLKTWDPTNPDGAAAVHTLADRGVSALEIDPDSLVDHSQRLQNLARSTLEKQISSLV